MRFRGLPKEAEAVVANSLNSAAAENPAFELFTSLRFDPRLLDLTRRIPIAMEESDDEVFFLSRLHYQRLRYGVKLLNWEVKFTHEMFINAMASAIQNTQEPHRIRVSVSRTGKLTATATAIPERDNLFSGLSDIPKGAESNDPVYKVVIGTESIPHSLYNSLKTSVRDHYTASRDKSGVSSSKEPAEVIICSPEGEAQEGSTTSIAVKGQNEEWITPPLKKGGAAGVLRSFLIELGFVQEGRVDISDLTPGAEVLLFNGVIGVCGGQIVEKL